MFCLCMGKVSMYYMEGDALKMLGQYNDSIYWFEKAMNLDP